METAKVMYEYETVIHGQLVTVKRYEPMLPSDALDLKFFDEVVEDEQV